MPWTAAPYHGAFDCYGTEGGLGAYAGRVTINADGTAVFRNFDDETQTGSWTRDQTTSAISFTGTDLSTAVYNAFVKAYSFKQLDKIREKKAS